MWNQLDLHMHSNISNDGEYSPTNLLRLCKEKGLKTVSLTDHNSIRGLVEAKASADQLGIEFINGIELDCQYEGCNLHLLGYGIDPTLAEFESNELDILKKEQAASIKRMELIRDLGIHFDTKKVMALAVEGVITGEMIAEVALEEKMNEANPLLEHYRENGERSDNPFVNFYWDFCAQGKPAYVPVEYMSLQAGIQLVKKAGGIAVLAHPGINIGLDQKKLEGIACCGLDGIEVYCSYHDEDTIAFYHEQADRFNLLKTMGSDFHGKTKPAIKMGNMHWKKEVEIYNELMKKLAKSRNKSVLNYKSPALWVVGVCITAMVVIAVGLMSNPIKAFKEQSAAETYMTPTTDSNSLKENLSLEKVQELSLKGDALTWQDFAPYNGREIGSGLYIMQYEIDADYHVLVGGGKLKGNPFYINLINKNTAEQIDIRTEHVGLFIASEITSADLTEQSIIEKELYEGTKYPLIAKLEKEDIYLYGIYPTGVILKYGDQVQIFDWVYTTPRFILPVLKKYDIDDDGRDEIICVLNVDSGTGVSVDELHVLKPDQTKDYIDYVFHDYMTHVEAMFMFAYNENENSISLKTNNDSYIYVLPTEFQKLTFKDIAYGSIVMFDTSNGLKIKMPLSVVFEEYASPQFMDDIIFEGDIEFKNGQFQITNSRITKN